jgi:hypothetical protein
MKHLLNNLTQEEKNNIREQHTGGIKINIDNFKKLVETKQGSTKPLLSEQNEDIERRDRYALKQYGDKWYDEDDRVLDSFDDYDEEYDFGPDDYDRFIELTSPANSKWNPVDSKGYYDTHYKRNMPISLRIKRGMK